MKEYRLYHLLLCLIIAATLILSGWYSFQHPFNIDLRDQPEWQVTTKQAAMMQRMDQVYIEAYVSQNPRMRRSIEALIRPLQNWIPSLHITFYNPETEPLKVRERRISKEGQIYIHNGEGRGSLVVLPSPSHIIDAVLALQPETNRQIIHLQGQNERGFLSDEAGSWRETYQHLQQSGVTVAAANRQSIATIPSGTNILVIAAPSPSSLDNAPLINNYLAEGGNMLYTTDFPKPYLPTWLARISGLDIIDNYIEDPDGRQYGIKDPKMLLITHLGDVDVVRSLSRSPLLAQATALTPIQNTESGWTRQAILYTSPQAHISQSNQTRVFATGWLLTRPKPNPTDDDSTLQRIIILSDSDLFSQHYRQIAGNAELIDSIFNTLLPENTTIAAATPAVLSDQYIHLSQSYRYGMAIVLLGLLPLFWCLYYAIYHRKQKCRYQ